MNRIALRPAVAPQRRAPGFTRDAIEWEELPSLAAALRRADTAPGVGHGRFDPMIALPRAVATRDALRALGYAVQWHEYAMEHSVCLPEIADLQQFLLRVLKR